jgi:hypothetical protein
MKGENDGCGERRVEGMFLKLVGHVRVESGQ